MNITLAHTMDDWSRSSLHASFHTEVETRVLIYAVYGDEVWWAKSPEPATGYEYSVMYHHVHDGQKRQVIVSCKALVQDCVIPMGFDPGQSHEAKVDLGKPSVLYACGIHSLGIIVLPRDATKSMRNHIWKLKDPFYSRELFPFAGALSHGRHGRFTMPETSSARVGPS